MQGRNTIAVRKHLTTRFTASSSMPQVKAADLTEVLSKGVVGAGAVGDVATAAAVATAGVSAGGAAIGRLIVKRWILISPRV